MKSVPWKVDLPVVTAAFERLARLAEKPCGSPDRLGTIGRCSTAACVTCRARAVLREVRQYGGEESSE